MIHNNTNLFIYLSIMTFSDNFKIYVIQMSFSNYKIGEIQYFKNTIHFQNLYIQFYNLKMAFE